MREAQWLCESHREAEVARFRSDLDAQVWTMSISVTCVVIDKRSIS